MKSSLVAWASFIHVITVKGADAEKWAEVLKYIQSQREVFDSALGLILRRDGKISEVWYDLEENGETVFRYEVCTEFCVSADKLYDDLKNHFPDDIIVWKIHDFHAYADPAPDNWEEDPDYTDLNQPEYCDSCEEYEYESC